MFENVNKPQQPAQPNEPKNWGPLTPKGPSKNAAGPLPPPSIGETVPPQGSAGPAVSPPPAGSTPIPPRVPPPAGGQIPPKPTATPQRPTAGMPPIPGMQESPKTPVPNKRKYIMIGLIIFSIIIVVIAGAVLALNYINQDENANTTTDVNDAGNTNIVENANVTANTNEVANSNVNVTNTIVNTNSVTNANGNANTNTSVNTNTSTNASANTNATANANTNTIINSALVDSDNDGLTDFREEIYATDPNNPDTDGDGYLDGEEVENGFNPLIPGGATL